MSKRNLVFLWIGVVLMAFGAGNTWVEYQRTHNPLDAVSSSDGPGQAAGHVPLFQPYTTRPAGLVPAPDNVAGPGSPAPGDATPESGGAAGNSQPAVSPGGAAQGFIPDRLVIDAIQLDAPIIPVRYHAVSLDDQLYNQWLAPNQYAVGWQDTSALLGLPGNSVFDGHHNAYGKVFKDLVNLNVGDGIDIYSGNRVFHYQVVIKMLVPERYQPIATRMANARWIAPTGDERITLITCWPASSNTHRVIVVAYPAPSH